MIWLLLFAALSGGFAIHLSKYPDSRKIYTKLAAIGCAFISVLFLYQFAYYYSIGEDIAKFGGGGTGISFTSNETGNTTTFYSSSDVQVGEYLSMQKANRDVIEILSGVLPYLALLLGGYLTWWYVETSLFGREKDGGMGGVT